MAKARTMADGKTKEVGLPHQERRASKKHLEAIHIKPAPRGKGVVFQHHYASGPNSGYEPPTEHPFGPGQGTQAAAHLARHVPFLGSDNDGDEEA